MTPVPSSESRRRRLLVLASTYPRWKDDPEPGFVHELARRLVLDFEITVICPHALGAARSECLDGVNIRRFRYAPGALETLVNNGGITTNLKRRPWKYLLVIPFLIGMLVSLVVELRRRRPTVVHAHWLVPQGLLAALLLPRSTPLVVTSHGADLYAWNSRVFKALKEYVVRRASATTVVSTPMVEEVLRLGGSPSRIFVAPMGIDFGERFSPSSVASRSTSEILFVGRLVEKKGLRYLIDAMPAILQAVPEAILTVAGFGPELRNLQIQSERVGVAPSIRFIGAVAQQDLPQLYRRAAVFVAPFIEDESGDREGLGLVTLEAAACGCPVVVSDVSVVHDAFQPSEVWFSKPADPQDIARQVVDVLTGSRRPPDSLYSSLAAKFDWGVVARRYLGVLSFAISEREDGGDMQAHG